jgi:uncharacterized membrane protein
VSSGPKALNFTAVGADPETYLPPPTTRPWHNSADAPTQTPDRNDRASAKSANPHQGRLVLVDFARALAIVFMIQGHALDVLLAPAYRQGAVFNYWLFLRGLTAPMFFTLSGVSFMVSSLRRWDSYSRPTPALFRRLGRFAFFILLGYALHWPAKTLHDFRYMDLAAWQGWLQVDVLQCIGVTLILLQIAILAAGTPARFAKLTGAVSALIVLGTPLIWAAHGIHRLPLSLASYFDSRTGSLFPVFPWAGYVFFGAAAGYLYVQWQSKPRAHAFWPLAGTGLALASLGTYFHSIWYKAPLHVYATAEFWRISPNLFLIRVGCVFGLLAVLAALLCAIKIPQRATRSLAQESLSIYFIHNCWLYGSIWNQGLRQRIGPNLAPLPTLLWIATIVVSMALLAWTWNWFKRNNPTNVHLLRAALFLAVAYSLM